MYEIKIAVVILDCARQAGKKGASLQSISKAIYKLDLFANWPDDGGIPSDTGGTLLDMAISNLLELNLISIEQPDFENSDFRFPYMGRVMSGVRVKLAEGFSILQRTLGYSLTENLSRTATSVLASPSFTLKRTTNFDVFVLMPFSEAMKSCYTNAILPVCRDRSLKCGRGNDFFGSDYIVDEIWTAIFHTRYIIADCTGQNANVLYELGMAHVLGKHVLIITQQPSDIPFDLRHRRYAVYEDSTNGMKELRREIDGFLESNPNR